ncbi:MAG: hypothetical protein QOH34_484 [Mycobacterium sp.]|jgi:hypothetical protein|nr:hypothetical protein [Mycobacterium sp.]
MTDLVGIRFADREVGRVPGWVIGLIRGQDRLFVSAACLRLVQRDLNHDGGVLGQSKQDLVELVVVVAEHIHLDAQPDSREQMHKHAVHVVAADVEDAEIRAGCWPECALAGVLGEVVQREGLKGVRRARSAALSTSAPVVEARC